jgi:hypothetical protein
MVRRRDSSSLGEARPTKDAHPKSRSEVRLLRGQAGDAEV